jgi:DNA-binding response OmpR family regulator
MAGHITLEDMVNLRGASILLVERTRTGLMVLNRVLAGFGVRSAVQCLSADEAIEHIKRTEFHLIIVEASLTDMDGYEFVRWLRQSGIEPNCFAPVVMLAGHTKKSRVTQARDCGANFIIAKPLSPRVLLERMIWVSREVRSFVETERYVGPDRRFKKQGGLEAPARRQDDSAAGPKGRSPPFLGPAKSKKAVA